LLYSTVDVGESVEISMKLGDVARALSGEVSGDPSVEVVRLVHPADAEGAGDLAFALSDEASAALAGSLAVAAVVRNGVDRPPGLSAVVYGGHERMGLAIVSALFARLPVHEPGVHASAVVARNARVAEGASIGPLVSVGPESTIGARSVVMAGASIGAGVTLGSDCLIHSGARIGDRVRLGDRVVVHANTVIGSDGYSFIPVRNPDGSRNPVETPARIHSLGSVEIGDDVEIGAGVTIDRGTLRDTRIGRGTKIDNQVQIAHNVLIGDSCIICGLVGIAGSAIVGDRAILGGAVGVSDHVTIGSDATVMAGADVGTNVPPGAVVQGSPAVPRGQNVERFMNIGRLKMLYPRVDDLAKRLEALEKRQEGG
jgi:UDP-3-O-[3-hydroxymyristoyl] glucosamine N-acyltransferase